jgi:two-component system response regulator CpxR
MHPPPHNSGMALTVLIADDDRAFCDLLGDYLKSNGFTVVAVHDGLSAVDRIDQAPPDAVVLDVMMPKADGFAVLQHVRSRHRVPILMLTARGEDVDRIVGLEMGADDYLAKPCNPRELAARLRAILRRARPQPGAGRLISVGDVCLSPSARSCTVRGQPVELTGAEFDVLRVLMEEAGVIVPREELVRLALKRRLGVFDRSIDMHVSRLRGKLNEPGAAPRIKTVRNRGYLYVAA